MKHAYLTLTLLAPLGACAGQGALLGGQLATGALSAIETGGAITPLTNICTALILQEAQTTHNLYAGLTALNATPGPVVITTPPPLITPVPPAPVPAPTPLPIPGLRTR